MRYRITYVLDGEDWYRIQEAAEADREGRSAPCLARDVLRSWLDGDLVPRGELPS